MYSTQTTHNAFGSEKKKYIQGIISKKEENDLYEN